MNKTPFLLGGIFSLSLLLPVLVSANADMPVVPVSVLKQDGQAVDQAVADDTKVKKSPETGEKPVTPAAITINNKNRLVMTPGINQIIPVAVGHPNRIITPFSNPEITSTSLGVSGEGGECGEICIKDNVIYVATAKKTPVTMFITERGSQTRALSLTMIPRKIPPREIELALENTLMGDFRLTTNSKAKAWEENQDYEEALRNVFRALANNNVPDGYTINRIPQGAVLPLCSSNDFTYDFSSGQYVRGHNLAVFVGVATNHSDYVREIQEPACGNWNVAAVAAWPFVVLEPGGKTEVFVVVKTARPARELKKRPSLIAGGQP